MRWDKAVISTRDAIFPAANLREAWNGRSEVIETDAPHLPDFQWIIDRWIIDKGLVTERFSRSIHSYDSEASVQNRVADHLWSLWQKYLGGSSTGTLIEIGYGTRIPHRPVCTEGQGNDMAAVGSDPCLGKPALPAAYPNSATQRLPYATCLRNRST